MCFHEERKANVNLLKCHWIVMRIASNFGNNITPRNNFLSQIHRSSTIYRIREKNFNF